MPEVSVLMPCYNAAETLSETMESLLEQSHPDFEIIIVDDGSTDQSSEILKKYSRTDARVKYFFREHLGIIPALNYGLQQCSGQLIARMDTDDICLPTRLEKQAQYLTENNNVDLVASLIEGFPKEDIRGGFHVYIDWLNSLVSDDQIKREIFVESPFAHPSVMFRKQAIDRLGGYQEHGWAEDYDLWLRMVQAEMNFAKIPEMLLRWRDHPPRLTRTDSRYSLTNFLRAKAHYLIKGPLVGRDAVIIWGAGMMGKRLSKQLLERGAPLVAFIEVDQAKIGRERRGVEIFGTPELKSIWARYDNPIVLTAVGARGARVLIRVELNANGLIEGRDWFAAA
jgi:glycosyltransferase involved in cell wall biosynthesis